MPTTLPAILTIAVLVTAIVLFLTNRLRPDLIALLVLVVLGLSGTLTPQEAFSGFSRSAVVTIVAIFVLAQGLYLTGASARVGEWLVRVAGTSERHLVVVVMAAGAFLSLFMNNIAAASVLLPAVSGAAQRRSVSASRLLMPLAFGTILGGMATLFTTVNIIASGLLREHDLPGFGVLDFAPVGLLATAAGILYMAQWGRLALPAQSAAEHLAAAEEGADLAEVYRLEERLFRARIPPGSYLDGKPLAQSTFREHFNLNVVAIEHQGRTLVAPGPEQVLHTGDVLTLEGILDDFRRQDTEPYLEILPAQGLHESDLESGEIEVAEIVLTPRSALLGKTLAEMHFRDKYGFTALGIWRGGRPIRRGLAHLRLEFGDALLIQGPRRRLPILRAERDLILLAAGTTRDLAPHPARMWIAIGILAVALLAAATGLAPTAEAVLAGGLLMVLVGCLTMEEAYAAIEWKAVFLVAGMLSLGLALTKTGVADWLAGALVQGLGPYGGYAVLAGLFVLTALLTQALSGQAVVAIVIPLAIQSAVQLHVDPRSLTMAVALATSLAFLTPLGHPVNVLVMGPGGYKFTDYARVGLPLTLVVGAVILIALPFFWPL